MKFLSKSKIFHSKKSQVFCSGLSVLTHCGLVVKYGIIWLIIDLGNGLLFGARWSSSEPMLTYQLIDGLSGTNFSEILIRMQLFSFIWKCCLQNGHQFVPATKNWIPMGVFAEKYGTHNVKN